MKTLLMQETVFVEKDVLKGLHQFDKEAEVQINRLIYYPYYFFEFEVHAKSLLKFNGKVGCTVDALGGRGAIVDVQPEFFASQVEHVAIPSIVIVQEEASKIAEEFVFEHASTKAKFITTPKIKQTSSQLFYRPFWIAEYRRNSEGQQLIVDAVSGSYHPL
ncbi:hypothetical protein [Sporosarcina pasteurii]|uniref:Uncharacterized protein n=1 Tax=Sporosarcina pasteurii TaxID=1474 RepID=A0A380BBG0_SPOPA|nr:hypothetical protein [Sporosarcina pasteurii]MDS9472867.1 hypothetical protein [Sporosarcina pasteurii]QBQ06418.1 hypothetical protein E2C16_12390 [Sporosarcina pasteurii]SUI98704.1 Uncharacterised protein [Sporosarcina pasteurii]